MAYMEVYYTYIYAIKEIGCETVERTGYRHSRG
jgi:hypothetical protein